MSMSQVAYLPVGKREQTKVQNRQAILDAAREVFGELGYETATVRDIIRRAGLAAGTFYNYYRSKEEVFAALADDGARRFGPILKGLRGHGHSFETFVELAIAAYFGFLADEHNNWAARRPAGLGVPGFELAGRAAEPEQDTMLLRLLRFLGEDRIVKQAGKTRRGGQRAARQPFQEQAPMNCMLVGAALAGRQLG